LFRVLVEAGFLSKDRDHGIQAPNIYRLWGFHNSRSGCCFPGYARIAERAGLAAPHCPRGVHRPVRPHVALARHPHVKRLCLPRSAGRGFGLA
jgi:hypothetical protein